MNYFNNVWENSKVFKEEVITPLVLKYNPYWLENEEVLDFEDLYKYFNSYYNNRNIMYEINNFKVRFMLRFQDVFIDFYKNIQIFIDDMFIQFKQKENLGTVYISNQDSKQHSESSFENTSEGISNNLKSNESTESTFDKLDDTDHVENRMKSVSENTGKGTNQGEAIGNLKKNTNQANYLNEYSRIINTRITLGIEKLIIEFNDLFVSMVVPNIKINKCHSI